MVCTHTVVDNYDCQASHKRKKRGWYMNIHKIDNMCTPYGHIQDFRLACNPKRNIKKMKR